MTIIGSIARAHLEGRDDGLARVGPLRERLNGRFADLLEADEAPERVSALRAAEGIGRPLGPEDFLNRLAALTGRDPRPGKPGRKPKAKQTSKE
jgi:putative transposase